jgi:hypothetical protein
MKAHWTRPSEEAALNSGDGTLSYLSAGAPVGVRLSIIVCSLGVHLCVGGVLLEPDSFHRGRRDVAACEAWGRRLKREGI